MAEKEQKHSDTTSRKYKEEIHMSVITKVQKCTYTGGYYATYWRVYYKNKNRYRNDRIRIYEDIPKSAMAFIETATDVSTTSLSDMDITTYKR